jgi:outer membrane protein
MKISGQYIKTSIFVKLSVLSGFLFLSSKPLLAQKRTLNLEQCYELAIENSPNLKTKLLDIVGADVAIDQAKMQFFPTLNAGGNHGYNWGQSIDPFTNTFASGRVRTNNFSVVLTWNIFTGLMNRYYLNMSHVNKLSLEEIYLLEKRNFKNEIASVYAKLQTDVLIKNLYEEQFAMTKILFENFVLKEKTGRIAPYELLRVQALMQQDSAMVVSAENTIRYTKFVLKQLLNSRDSSGLEYDFLVLTEEELVDGLRIFQEWNVDTMQEIRVAQISKDIAEIEYKIYKSQLLPRLTIHSAVGSGYSGNNTELIGTNLVAKPMDVQLRENLYQTAVITLSVPIFNAYRVRNQLKLSEIKIQQAQLNIEQTQIELNNFVERLLLEYENEVINLKAQKKIYETYQELFDASEKMYSNGLTNYVDYAEAKFSVTQSRLDYLISLSKSYGILLFLENLIL